MNKNILIALLMILLISACGGRMEKFIYVNESALENEVNNPTQIAHPTNTIKPISTLTPTLTAQPTSMPDPTPTVYIIGSSRGYQTTPEELREIARKAEMGIEPYASAVRHLMVYANRNWNFGLRVNEICGDADSPRWIDNSGGTPILFAKAIAYHLTGDETYALEVKDIIEKIISSVETISLEIPRCELTFGWGIPELISAADLIEATLINSECRGPESTIFGENQIVMDNCKMLFQNWLVKNPYYVISLAAEESLNNWGAAATNTVAHIADYLWDRPDLNLVHRVTEGADNEGYFLLSPREAYFYANQLAIDRMNGYRIDIRSWYACDYFKTPEQSPAWDYVKSQITEAGIIPDDSRREQFCNIPKYNGYYQNYPQIHLGNNIQQCELMLRRGDPSCYDNIDWSDLPKYEFVGTDGEIKVTHLYPGRGSIERAIQAVIVDSNTEWRHDSALEIAYRYYIINGTLPEKEMWYQELVIGRPLTCGQDACFGTLTHGFAPDEAPALPPVVAPP